LISRHLADLDSSLRAVRTESYQRSDKRDTISLTLFLENFSVNLLRNRDVNSSIVLLTGPRRGEPKLKILQ
jgi:hypothetical protein